MLGVVIFILDEVKRRAGPQAFPFQPQGDIDQVDGGILRMARGGHHGHQPAPQMPGGQQFRALLRTVHLQVQAQYRPERGRLSAHDKLHGMPEGGIGSLLEAIQDLEPPSQSLIVRAAGQALEQLQAGRTQPVAQDGPAPHEQVRRQLLISELVSAHVDHSQRRAPFLPDLLQAL